MRILKPELYLAVLLALPIACKTLDPQTSRLESSEERPYQFLSDPEAWRQMLFEMAKDLEQRYTQQEGEIKATDISPHLSGNALQLYQFFVRDHANYIKMFGFDSESYLASDEVNRRYIDYMENTFGERIPVNSELFRIFRMFYSIEDYDPFLISTPYGLQSWQATFKFLELQRLRQSDRPRYENLQFIAENRTLESVEAMAEYTSMRAQDIYGAVHRYYHGVLDPWASGSGDSSAIVGKALSQKLLDRLGITVLSSANRSQACIDVFRTLRTRGLADEQALQQTTVELAELSIGAEALRNHLHYKKVLLKSDRWSETELAQLKDFVEKNTVGEGVLDFHPVATSIGRTSVACEKKARDEGWIGERIGASTAPRDLTDPDITDHKVWLKRDGVYNRKNLEAWISRNILNHSKEDFGRRLGIKVGSVGGLFRVLGIRPLGKANKRYMRSKKATTDAVRREARGEDGVLRIPSKKRKKGYGEMLPVYREQVLWLFVEQWLEAYDTEYSEWLADTDKEIGVFFPKKSGVTASQLRKWGHSDTKLYGKKGLFPSANDIYKGVLVLRNRLLTLENSPEYDPSTRYWKLAHLTAKTIGRASSSKSSLVDILDLDRTHLKNLVISSEIAWIKQNVIRGSKKFSATIASKITGLSSTALHSTTDYSKKNGRKFPSRVFDSLTEHAQMLDDALTSEGIDFNWVKHTSFSTRTDRSNQEDINNFVRLFLERDREKFRNEKVFQWLHWLAKKGRFINVENHQAWTQIIGVSARALFRRGTARNSNRFIFEDDPEKSAQLKFYEKAQKLAPLLINQLKQRGYKNDSLELKRLQAFQKLDFSDNTHSADALNAAFESAGLSSTPRNDQEIATIMKDQCMLDACKCAASEATAL